MGDRCYMQLTCRASDKTIFEALGFTEQGESDPPYYGCVEMVDEEADNGHYDEMPGNVVYFGGHCAGDNYGAMTFVCDGEEYLDAGDIDGAYPVRFTPDGEPQPVDLAEIKRFVLHEKKVTAMLSHEGGCLGTDCNMTKGSLDCHLRERVATLRKKKRHNVKRNQVRQSDQLSGS